MIKQKHEFLILEARRWVGMTEVGGNNKGQLVEMWQKSVDNVAMQESWCFTGDTEIFTENGWVRFDELDPYEKVAQVSSDRTMSFVVPNNMIKKDYCGDGWRIKTRSIDLVCDKNHRFYGYFNNSKTPRFGTMDECTSSLKIDFPTKINSSGVKLDNDQLKFLAAFLSDGFFSKTRNGTPRIKIQVSKTRKISCLRDMNPVGEFTASRCYGMTKTPLTTFTFLVPDWFENVFDDYKVVYWSFINSLTTEQAKVFLDAYCIFDGHVKGNSKRLFSSRKNLADQLLSVAIIAGYAPQMTHITSKLSNKPNWIIRWAENCKTKNIKKSHISSVKIKEKLYCVSVPDERIIVRGQSGTPLVVGNCMAFVQSMLVWTDRVFWDIHHFKPFTHVYKSEHCMTVWHKTPKEFRSAIPLLGSIAIWNKKGTPQGHTGIVSSVLPSARKFLCIEGNTGPGDGVEREGQGVFEKSRSTDGAGEMELLGFIVPWAD